MIRYRKMFDGRWCLIADTAYLAVGADVTVTTKAGKRHVETVTELVGAYRGEYVYDFAQRAGLLPVRD